MKPINIKKPIKDNTSKLEESILYDEVNRVVTLTLNRPKNYNALTEEMLKSLQNFLDDVANNKSVRIVILQGNGKAFCAGHDLKEMIATRKEAYYKKYSKRSYSFNCFCYTFLNRYNPIFYLKYTGTYNFAGTFVLFNISCCAV